MPMPADDLTVSGGHRAGGPVSMTCVDVVTTSRPAGSVATVRVRNDGPRTARLTLFAVDDWSSAGPVPAEPSRIDLPPGRHRSVLVRMGRPWLRPLGRERTGTVTVYADTGGDLVPGPRYAVPPRVSRVTAAAGVAVLLAGLGAALVRPATDTGVLTPTAVPPVAPFDPPPPSDLGHTALPADLVFDLPTADGVRAPVLVDRDRTATTLPAGGPVTAAVKVPSGWVVKRRGDGGRFQLLHLRGQRVVDLAPDAADPLFWVDDDGTRVLIDNRAGGAGAVTVATLPDDSSEATTRLPAHVRVVTWDGPSILVSVPDAAGTPRYDWWATDQPYRETPSRFEGSYLGFAGGALVIHQRDGTLDCILRVPDLFRPISPALRCGFGVAVDTDALQGRWTAVSPGGNYAAVPGPSGTVHVTALPALLAGRAGFQAVTGLPGPTTALTWRDGGTAAALVRGDSAHVWTCVAADAACRATALDGPAGLTPTLLVPRLPAGR